MNIFVKRLEKFPRLPLAAGGGLLLNGYTIQEADNRGVKNSGKNRCLDERVDIRGQKL
jgi:hypothetical protein